MSRFLHHEVAQRTELEFLLEKFCVWGLRRPKNFFEAAIRFGVDSATLLCFSTSMVMAPEIAREGGLNKSRRAGNLYKGDGSFARNPASSFSRLEYPLDARKLPKKAPGTRPVYGEAKLAETLCNSFV